MKRGVRAGAAALAAAWGRGTGTLRRRWERACTAVALLPLPGPRRLSREDTETLAWFRYLRIHRDDHT